MNQNTKQLDKLLTNVINVVKSGAFTDAQVQDIYSSDGVQTAKITRNEDGTFNVSVSLPQADGIGRDIMAEENVQS